MEDSRKRCLNGSRNLALTVGGIEVLSKSGNWNTEAQQSCLKYIRNFWMEELRTEFVGELET